MIRKFLFCMSVLFSAMIIAGCSKDKIEDPVIPEKSISVGILGLYQFDSLAGYGFDDSFVKAYDNKGTTIKVSDGGYIRYDGNGLFAYQGEIAQSIIEKVGNSILIEGTDRTYYGPCFINGSASYNNYLYVPTIKNGKLCICKFSVTENATTTSPEKYLQIASYSFDKDIEMKSSFQYENGDIASFDLGFIGINKAVINDNYMCLYFLYGRESSSFWKFEKNVLFFINTNRCISFFDLKYSSTSTYKKTVLDWYNKSVLVPVPGDSCAIYSYEGNLLYKIKTKFPNQTYYYPINYTEYISIGSSISRNELSESSSTKNHWTTYISSIPNFPKNVIISNSKILSANGSVWTFLCTVQYSDNSTKDITLDVDINTGKVTVK